MLHLAQEGSGTIPSYSDEFNPYSDLSEDEDDAFTQEMKQAYEDSKTVNSCELVGGLAAAGATYAEAFAFYLNIPSSSPIGGGLAGVGVLLLEELAGVLEEVSEENFEKDRQYLCD